MNNNPHFPQRHLYILSSKKTIIQCILWSTGKTGKRMIWMYLTDIPHASVLNNSWIQHNVSACFCLEMYLFSPQHIWIVFKYVLQIFGFCVSASFLTVRVWLCCAWFWFTALCCGSECTGMVLLSDHQMTLSSPARFVRLSWLCIIVVIVTLRNEVMRPTLSRMRPTR